MVSITPTLQNQDKMSLKKREHMVCKEVGMRMERSYTKHFKNYFQLSYW